MKVTISVLLTVGMVAQVVAEEVEDYPVKGIDPSSEKFERIYRAVADVDERARKAKQKTYKMEVLSNISEGFYLVRDTDKTYAVKIPGKVIPDDTKVALPFVLTDEVYQYTTVLGGKATVAMLKLAEPVVRLTKKDFIQGLMDGTTITIVLKVGEKGCRTCYGSGRVGGGVGVKSKICIKCRGSKKQAIMKKYRIRW